MNSKVGSLEKERLYVMGCDEPVMIRSGETKVVAFHEASIDMNLRDVFLPLKASENVAFLDVTIDGRTLFPEGPPTSRIEEDVNARRLHVHLNRTFLSCLSILQVLVKNVGEGEYLARAAVVGYCVAES